MYEGRFIEYIEQGRITCTLCLQDKTNKLHLLSLTKRQITLSLQRALLISSRGVDVSLPREELLASLQQTHQRRDRLKDEVDVRELWELLYEGNETFDHSYLGQVVFGEGADDDHISATVRAIFDDRVYFKLTDGRFRPNPPYRVEQILKQRRQEARKKEFLNQAGHWLKELRTGKTPEPPPECDEITRLLAQWVLHGRESPDFKLCNEMLSMAGIQSAAEIRRLLVTLGIWEEDENLDLLRLGIETDFGRPQLAEAARLAETAPTLEGREDLRDLPAFTIDGPLTGDFDDALSVEVLEQGFRIGIHIADVSAVITPDSALDREAGYRASSLYLPRRQISMLPMDLSQGTLSLRQGRDRNAISVLAEVDTTGNLYSSRITPSLIRVQRRMTYDEADQEVSQNTLIQELHRISQGLRQQRLDRGALNLSLPEVQFSQSDNGTLTVMLVSQDTPARTIVAELMILYNYLVAKFCKEHGVPILYRTQTEPSEILPREGSSHLFYVFQQRRKLSPLLIGTSPRPHSGLGLEVYTQASSPIRRYLDLVIQRQLKGLLMGTGACAGEEQLEEIRTAVAPVLRSLQLVKRNRQRYWTLKYLSGRQGEVFPALVLDKLRRKYRLVLSDLLLIAEINRSQGLDLAPGQEISVTIRSVDPWEDHLELQLG